MKVILAVALTLALLAAAVDGLASTQDTADADFPAASMSTDLVFQCEADGSIVTGFGWQTSNQGLQWFDISLSDDGFSSGYATVGPMPSDQAGLAWYSLQPSTWYFVRVNTLTSYGWFASQTMHFYTPDECRYEVSPGSVTYTPATCTGLSTRSLSGCVWTERGDYGSFDIGETVTYCYNVNEPTDLRIVVAKPDRTSLIVIDGFVNGTGACIGPFMANDPEGLRTVRMYGDGGLIAETHFYVED